MNYNYLFFSILFLIPAPTANIQADSKYPNEPYSIAASMIPGMAVGYAVEKVRQEVQRPMPGLWPLFWFLAWDLREALLWGVSRQLNFNGIAHDEGLMHTVGTITAWATWWNSDEYHPILISIR